MNSTLEDNDDGEENNRKEEKKRQEGGTRTEEEIKKKGEIKGNRVDREIERRMKIWKEWMEDEWYGDVVLTERIEGAEVE